MHAPTARLWMNYAHAPTPRIEESCVMALGRGAGIHAHGPQPHGLMEGKQPPQPHLSEDAWALWGEEGRTARLLLWAHPRPTWVP